MKIRLRIVAAGQTRVFEHPGPVVCVGRDPGCELSFEGQASTGVSRQHSRIELSAAAATLADAGSSNGTLHNDHPVTGTVPIRAGDRIQLGYTGPVLTVLQIDLAAPKPAAGMPPRLVLLGGGAAAALVALLLLVVGVWALTRSPAPPSSEPSPAVAQAPAPAPPPPAPRPTETVKGPAPESVPETTPAKPPPPPANGKSPRSPKAPLPEPDRPPPAPAVSKEDAPEVPVGRYVSLPDWGPSVLLTRRGEAYPWAPLRPEGKVLTARTLLSLPGYRSEVLLDSKVQLTLWGNVPEFGAVPPLLLESAVMLNAPEQGADLDVTLEWGRIKIANRKESGPARVRLRFQREVWDLTLPAPDSEVCAELWSALPPPAAEGQRKRQPLVLGLFARKPVTLHRTGARREQLDLAERERVAWTGGSGAALYREVMPQLPGWWAKPPDTADSRVQDAMVSLQDWSTRLGGAGDLVETILKTVREAAADPGLREQGMYQLAALDAPLLVTFLEDAQHSRVRRAAAHGLRAWLSRGAGRDAQLKDYLKIQVKSPQKAALVLQLLLPYAAEDLKRADTYQKLIGLLDDDSLAVRELASWHLEELAPEAARRLAYDPKEGGDQRRQAVAEWKKQLPPGTVPRQPTP
jgi:hypothetical protein